MTIHISCKLITRHCTEFVGVHSSFFSLEEMKKKKHPNALSLIRKCVAEIKFLDSVVAFVCMRVQIIDKSLMTFRG